MQFSGGKPKASGPTNSPDTYAAQDTIELVLAVARGPIKGLSKGLKGVYLNNTALQNVDGSSNFGDVTVDVVTGATPDEKFKLSLGGISSSTTINTTLASSVPVTRTLQQTNYDFIDFRFAIQQLVSQSEKGQSGAELKLKLEYKATASATWLPVPFGGLSAAPPAGTYQLTSGYDVQSPTRLTTVSNATPTIATVGDRWISPSNAFFREYNGSSWNTIGATFSNGVWTTPSGEKVYMGVPTITVENPRANDSVYTGTEVVEYNGAAWVNNTVNFNTLYQPVNTSGNSYGATGILVVNEKISSLSAKEVRVFLPPIAGTYDVRVTKLSPDTITDQLYSVVAWESCQAGLTKPLDMHGVGGIRLKARASDQFSSVPQITGDWDLLITKVPSNYDPETRTYTGVWDGTWKSAFHNNPMWAACDLILDEVDGMSAAYPQTIDKWAAYDIARWCDDSINDGMGGTRPRHTYNKLDTDGLDAAQRVTDILGSCNTRYIDDGSGNISFICDKDSNPVAIFALENCTEQGAFVYSYTDPITRANEVTVTFQNKEMNYEEDRRVVRQDGAQERIPDAFFAVGKTNASEAVAAALYRMITNLTEICSVVFTTDRRAKYLGLWETILIADERQAWGLTHRIKSFAGNTIQLFEPISLEVGVTYQIILEYVNASTGAREPLTRTITSAAGIVSALTLNQALPSDILPDAVFSLSSATTVGLPQKFRITSIKSNDDDSYSVSAIQVNPLKHYLIENWAGTAYTDNSEVTNSRFTGRVRNVKTSYNFADNVVYFSWDAPVLGLVESYQLEVSESRAGPYTVVSKGRARNSVFPVVSNFPNLFYRITAFPLIGLPSLPVEGIFNLSEIATRGSQVIVGPLPSSDLAILGMVYSDPTQPGKLWQRSRDGTEWLLISTIGATIEEDLRLPDGTLAPVERIDNTLISIDPTTGRLLNTGAGNTVVDNSRIALSDGAVGVINSEIVAARGIHLALSAAIQDAASRAQYLNVVGRPLTLTQLDSAASTLLTNTNNELVTARGGQATLLAQLNTRATTAALTTVSNTLATTNASLATAQSNITTLTSNLTLKADISYVNQEIATVTGANTTTSASVAALTVRMGNVETGKAEIAALSQLQTTVGNNHSAFTSFQAAQTTTNNATLTTLNQTITRVTNSETAISTLTTQQNTDRTSAATTSNILSARVSGAERASSIANNPAFTDWPVANTIATGWLNWNNGTDAVTRVTGTLGSPAVQFNTAGKTAHGWRQNLSGRLTQGWYVLEFTLTLVSGSLQNTALQIQWGPSSGIVSNNAINPALDSDINGVVVGNGVAGTLYRWSKLVQVTGDCTLVNFNLLAAWGGTTQINKVVNVEWASLRPASAAEIEARAATATLIPALQATSTANTTAIANLDTSKATVVSVNNLQTNLQGQINTRATNARVDQVESSAAASIAASATALTTAFQTADAGLQTQVNGRATITSLNEAVSNASSALTTARTQMESEFRGADSTLSSRASSLELRSTNLENSRATTVYVNQQVATLVAADGTLTSSLGAVTTRVGTLETNSATVTQLSTLSGTVGSNHAEFNTFKNLQVADNAVVASRLNNLEVTSPSNMLRNSTFALGLSGWTLSNAPQAFTFGDHSYVTFLPGGHRSVYQDVGVSVGVRYSFRALLIGVDGHRSGVWGEWRNSSGGFLGYTQFLYSSGSSWTVATSSSTNANNVAPANAVTLRFYADNFLSTPYPATGWSGVREIMLVRGSVVGAWADTGSAPFLNVSIQEQAAARLSGDTALGVRASTLEARTESPNPNLWPHPNGNATGAPLTEIGWTTSTPSLVQMYWTGLGGAVLGRNFTDLSVGSAQENHATILIQQTGNHTVSMWANVNNMTAEWSVASLNASNAIITQSSWVSFVTSSTSRQSVTINTGAGATQLRLIVRIPAQTRAGFSALYWRQIKAEIGSVATQYSEEAALRTTLARLVTEESTRSTADSALGTRASTLEAQMTGASGSGLLTNINSRATISYVDSVNTTQNDIIATQGSEIVAARQGSTSMSVRLTAINDARISGDNTLATRASALEARSGTAQNLIPNGDFSVGTQGWTIVGLTRSEAWNGIRLNGSGGSVSALSPRFPVIATGTITAGFSRTSVRTANPLRLRIRWYNVSDVEITPATSYTDTQASNEFSRVTQTATPPANSAWARVELASTGTGTGYIEARLVTCVTGSIDMPSAVSSATSSQLSTLISSETTARTSAISSLGGQISTIETTLNHPTTGLASKASIAALDVAESTLNTSRALLATEVRSRFSGATQPNLLPNGLFIRGKENWLNTHPNSFVVVDGLWSRLSLRSTYLSTDVGNFYPYTDANVSGTSFRTATFAVQVDSYWQINSGTQNASGVHIYAERRATATGVWSAIAGSSVSTTVAQITRYRQFVTVPAGTDRIRLVIWIDKRTGSGEFLHILSNAMISEWRSAIPVAGPNVVLEDYFPIPNDDVGQSVTYGTTQASISAAQLTATTAADSAAALRSEINATYTGGATSLSGRLTNISQVAADANSARALEIQSLNLMVQARPNLMPWPNPVNQRTPASLGWNGAITAGTWPPLARDFYFRRITNPTGQTEFYFYDVLNLPPAAYTLSAWGWGVSMFIEVRNTSSPFALIHTSPVVDLSDYTTTIRKSVSIAASVFGGANRNVRIVFRRVFPTATGAFDANFGDIKLEAGSNATLYSADGQARQLAAEITSTQSLTADLQGRVSAYLGFRAVANGQTSIELMNGTNQVYNGLIRLTAGQIELDGDVILNGLSFGDLTRVASVVNQNPVILPVGSWTVVAQLSITKAGIATGILGKCTAVLVPPWSQNFYADMRITRNGVIVFEATNLGRAAKSNRTWLANQTTVQSPTFVDSPDAGTHVYKIEMRAYENAGSVSSSTLAIEERLK